MFCPYTAHARSLCNHARMVISRPPWPTRNFTIHKKKTNNRKYIYFIYIRKKKMFFHFTHTHTVHARWIIWTHAASMLWRSNFFLAAKLAKTAQTCVNIFIISHQCRCKWVQRLSLVWRAKTVARIKHPFFCTARSSRMRKLMARNVKGERKNKNVKKGIKMMEMRAARRHGQPIIIIIIHHSCSVMGRIVNI